VRGFFFLTVAFSGPEFPFFLADISLKGENIYNVSLQIFIGESSLPPRSKRQQD